jgi:branched-chain amino acid aminotransferase
MSRKIWIDGTLRSSSEGTIPLSANALHYGTGAFEGILCIRNGRAHTIFRAKDHIDRLFRSAGLLGLEIPFTEETLARALQEFVTGNKYGSCYLRPVVFSDGDFLSFGTAKKKAHAAILGKRFPAAFYWWRMKRPIRITIADQPRSTLTGP